MRTIKITREQFDQLGLLPADFITASTLLESAYHSRLAVSRLDWDPKFRKLNAPPQYSHADGWFLHAGRAGAALPPGINTIGVPLRAAVVYRVGRKDKDGSFILEPVALADKKLSTLAYDEGRRYTFDASEADERARKEAGEAHKRGENQLPYSQTAIDADLKASARGWKQHLMSPLPDTNNMGQFAPADQTRAQQREEMSQVQRAAHTTQPKGPITKRVENLRAAENAEPTQ